MLQHTLGVATSLFQYTIGSSFLYTVKPNAVKRMEVVASFVQLYKSFNLVAYHEITVLICQLVLTMFLLSVIYSKHLISIFFPSRCCGFWIDRWIPWKKIHFNHQPASFHSMLNHFYTLPCPIALSPVHCAVSGSTADQFWFYSLGRTVTNGANCTGIYSQQI